MIKSFYQKNVRNNISKIIIGIVFILAIFLPLIKIFTNMDGETFNKVIHSASFLKSIKNSLISTTLSTIITITLAYALAICVDRVNIKLKRFFKILFILPMLIPSLSNGMGLVLLFGNNGILTNLFNINFNIYGLGGIVLGSVIYAFPVAFLMISDILKYEDSSPYDAAKILGIPRHKQFMSISLPYLRKPLISVVFAVFTLILSDYGVPLILGGKFTTMPVLLYNEVIGQVNFAKGAIYGLFLLIPAVIAFIVDLFNKDKGNSNFVTKEFKPSNKTSHKVISYIFCALISLIFVMPIISFAIISFAKKYPINKSFTFDNVLKTLEFNAGQFLLNSILIALFVGILGVVICFITAYMTARQKNKMSKFLHLSAITSAAVPGLVLGLAYVLFFKGSFIYGTLAVLIMVNVVHFISSPYLMMYNSLSKINKNIEGVGASLGIKKFHLIKDVFIPQTKNTLIEMFSYFFVNSMMTISAVSFLATYDNKPLSVLLLQFEDRHIECAAVISLTILLVNLAIKGIAFLLKNIKSKKYKEKN